MPIVITTISILVITGLVWSLNKVLPFRACPICAGVSLTWFLTLVGVLTGQLLITDYQLPIAILMGGTVVGISYQGEKRMSIAPENVLRFRTAIIVPGFILVYFALNYISWLTLVLEGVVLAVVTWFYFIAPTGAMTRRNTGERVKELEEKMKNCC